MDICVQCKHHRKEGRMGIRCYAGVIEQIKRNPVTGAVYTRRSSEPADCEARRMVHQDTCPDYAPLEG